MQRRTVQNLVLCFFLAFVLFNFIISGYFAQEDEPQDDSQEERSELELSSSSHNGLQNRISPSLKLNVNKIMTYCNQRKLVEEKIRVEECLNYLENYEDDYLTPITEPYEQFMLFHMYWKGEVTQKLALVIKSFLFTQPLNRSKVVVWLKADENNQNFLTSLMNNPYAKPLLEFYRNVEFRRFETSDQIEYPGSPWKVSADVLEREDTVSFSDTVRFILLERYGGVYIDADVILLRDFSPLFAMNRQFAYNWSNLSNKVNTAVFHLRRGSNLARKMIAKLSPNPKHNAQPFYPYKVLKVSQSLPEQDRIINFPVALFDPLWLKHDGVQVRSILEPNLTSFEDVFDANLGGDFSETDSATVLRKIGRFFSGAFSYHWHNRWKKEIPHASWLATLEYCYEAFLEGKTHNLYGNFVVK